MRNLGDVQQPFHSRFQLDEGPEVGNPSHPTADDRLHRVARGDLVPGVGHQVAHRERDFAGRGVYFVHFHLHLVPFGNQLLRVADPGPAHAADGHQTVHAAQVHEHPKGLNPHHFAGAHLAGSQLGQQAFPGFGSLLFQHRPMAKHQIAPLRVGFHHPAQQSLAQVGTQVVHSLQGHLADGNESADVAHFALQPALVLAGDGRFDERAGLKVVPTFHLRSGRWQAERVKSFFLVEPGYEHFDRLAHLRGLFFRVELLQGEHALVAAAQVHKHVFGRDGKNPPSLAAFEVRFGQLAAGGLHQVGIERLPGQGGFDLLLQVFRQIHLHLFQGDGRHFRLQGNFRRRLLRGAATAAAARGGRFQMLLGLPGSGTRRQGRGFGCRLAQGG